MDEKLRQLLLGMDFPDPEKLCETLSDEEFYGLGELIKSVAISERVRAVKIDFSEKISSVFETYDVGADN